MKPKIDLSGTRFGRLVVTGLHGKSRTGCYLWDCRCDCGTSRVIYATALRSGKTRSCGCLNAECRGKSSITHGLRYSKLYPVWNDMKRRCASPSHHAYKHYGARGIQVCEEWRNDFSVFHSWAIANGYTDGLSIDRINNDLGYQPHNCHFIKMSEQQRNRRCSRFIAHNGKTMILSEWARLFGISVGALHSRLKTKTLAEIELSIQGKS